MKLILLGPVGSGKGTQARLIKEEYNLPHISTGEIFRTNIQNETELGKIAKQYIDNGDLVPEELVNKLVEDRIAQDDCANGFILDGYPRNLVQAKILNNLLEELNIEKYYVIFFNIDKETALKRTLSRIICSSCGSSYNLLIEDLKPKKENICDRCNNELKTRTDDTEEVFIHRFDTYLNSTKDLIEYYQNKGLLHKIDVSTKSAETIFEEVKEILND